MPSVRETGTYRSNAGTVMDDTMPSAMKAGMVTGDSFRFLCVLVGLICTIVWG